MATALLDETTREALRSKASEVERLVDAIDERPSAAEKLKARRERLARSYRAVEDAVLDLTNALPAGTEDYEARQLFRFLIELKRAVEEDKEGRVGLAAMKMSDVIRRIERRLEHAVLETPSEAARYLFAQLDGVPATELGRLLGVSAKTVGNWKAGAPVRQRVDRLRLVAQLVAYLRYSMTQTGLVLWFDNPADLLGGHAPIELLEGDLVEAWEPLVGYARGGRAQLAG